MLWRNVPGAVLLRHRRISDMTKRSSNIGEYIFHPIHDDSPNHITGSHMTVFPRRICYRRRHRQRRGVPQGTRLRRMARSRATAVLDRWQGQAAGHQQARQHLPAQGAHPRSTSRRDAHKTRSLSDRSMDERTGSQSAAQRAGRRDGEQARSHRLGRALDRRRLPPCKHIAV